MKKGIKKRKKIGIQVTLDIAITIFIISFVLAYALNVQPVIQNQNLLEEYINEHCINPITGYAPYEIEVYNDNERILDERIPFYQPNFINYTIP